MSRFMDENGSGDYLQIAADDVVGFRVGVRPGAPPVVNLSSSDARAVAAEIIACADRIEGKLAVGRDEVNPFCIPQVDTLETMRVIKECVVPSTPTHTSHASLVVFAKAIAYLPTPLRDELNALLASKLRVALQA